MGTGCLAIGLAGGYLLPRGGNVASPAAVEAPATKSARSASGRAVASRSDEARKFRQSIPAADKYTERTQWLESLETGKLAIVIESLCMDAGPNGLAYPDKSLLENALKKWWKEDREGAIKWASQLPSGGIKRFMMKFTLEELLKDDAPRALEISEAYAAEDAGWSQVDFRDKSVGTVIDAAWEKPATTAEEMLDLYSQLSRGSGVTGSNLGRYPDDFDFRKFLDGIDARNREDKKQPSGMPSDALEAWAKRDPQAATEWFLTLTENGGYVTFQEWADIATAVSTTSGPQAYYEWTAEVIARSTEKQRKAIFENTGNSDALGIANQITDVVLRDTVLAAVARRNSGTVGNSEQTIDFLSRISTPEARLQAIRKDASQYAWWLKTYPISDAAYGKLGLTKEQFAAAITEKD